MKIAIVGPTFPYKGGGAHHTTELAHRLAGAGHEVTLESWRAQYPSFLYPGRQTISAPEGTPFDPTRRELSWRRPDGWLRTGRRMRCHDLVVFTVLSPVQVPAYLGIRYGLRGQARVVALCHNVLPHERKPYDVPLMRTLLRGVDGVLVHSAQQAELARSLTGRPVHEAEMPAHLPCAPARREPQRDHCGAGAGAGAGGSGGGEPRNRLLFFGMVRPYKGLDVLLRAVAAGPGEVALTVAGEFWGGLDDTRRLIDELGLSERVQLRPGYVPADEVPGLFATADALVLPYRSATASQNVWMAYEHGVPVIATRVGGFGRQIRDGVDGLVCEPDDADSLTKALERFYTPGEPRRLRDGVRPVDHGPLWAAYLDALLQAPSS